MSEQKVVNDILDLVVRDGLNSFAIKYHGTATGRGGVPDLIGSWRGRPFAIEVKKTGQETKGLSLLQVAWLRRFGNGGYVVGVVSSNQDFLNLFLPIDKNEKSV